MRRKRGAHPNRPGLRPEAVFWHAHLAGGATVSRNERENTARVTGGAEGLGLDRLDAKERLEGPMAEYRMKVLHVAHGTPPGLPLGDPLHYVLRLAQVQQAMGYDVTVVCASERDETQQVGEVMVRCLKSADPQRTDNDQAADALAGVIAGEQADVVHVHSLRGWTPAVVELAQGAGAACVLGVLDYAGLCPRGDLHEGGVEPCAGPAPGRCGACCGDEHPMEMAAWSVQALSEADVVLATGERIRAELIRQGVAPAALQLHGQGSDTAHELWRALGQARRDEARARLARTPGTLHLLLAGMHDRHSGLLRALEALGQVEGVSLTLVGPLAGDDPVVAASLAAASEHICHIPEVTVDALIGAYRSADAALVIPEWEDPAPQAALHALGAALPVIGTEIGAIPARVHDGATGLLTLPGSTQALVRAIERLRDESVLLPTLTRRIHSPPPMSAQAADLVPVYVTARRARRAALSAA